MTQTKGNKIALQGSGKAGKGRSRRASGESPGRSPFFRLVDVIVACRLASSAPDLRGSFLAGVMPAGVRGKAKQGWPDLGGRRAYFWSASFKPFCASMPVGPWNCPLHAYRLRKEASRCGVHRLVESFRVKLPEPRAQAGSTLIESNYERARETSSLYEPPTSRKALTQRAGPDHSFTLRKFGARLDPPQLFISPSNTTSATRRSAQ